MTDTGPRGRFGCGRFVRKPLVVPETKPLNQLIDEFQKSHTHMALVVDEFGTVTGLVTLGDILQQVLAISGMSMTWCGRLQVCRRRRLRWRGAPAFGNWRRATTFCCLARRSLKSLAGFLLLHFGHIPKVKERVDYGGGGLRVTEMERNRIAKDEY